MQQLSVSESAGSRTLHLGQTLPWQGRRTQAGGTTAAAHCGLLWSSTWTSEEYSRTETLPCAAGAGGRWELFRWSSYVLQRLPERGIQGTPNHHPEPTLTPYPHSPRFRLHHDFSSPDTTTTWNLPFCQHNYFCQPHLWAPFLFSAAAAQSICNYTHIQNCNISLTRIGSTVTDSQTEFEIKVQDWEKCVT